MAPRTTPILFLGGAGLPAWIWDEVRDALGGTTAVAPAGLGDGLESAALAAFGYAAPEPFAIVAHGAAGVLAAEMARLDPESVAAVIGVAAVIPRSGESYLDTVPFPASVAAKRAVRGGGVHPTLVKLQRGLDDGIAARLRADVVDEPEGRFRDPLRQLLLPPRRGYIVTTGDTHVLPEWQRGFARILDTAPETLNGDHLPMLTRPRELAAAIERQLG